MALLAVFGQNKTKVGLKVIFAELQEVTLVRQNKTKVGLKGAIYIAIYIYKI